MSAPADCQLVGRWRIVEANFWDRDHLDLCGPAAITIGAERRGEIAFGAMEASFEIAYGRTSIDFNLIGFDEGEDVSGVSSAELLDDGSIEIEFAPSSTIGCGFRRGADQGGYLRAQELD